MNYFLEFKGSILLGYWLQAPKKHKSHTFQLNLFKIKQNQEFWRTHFNCSIRLMGQYSIINADE